MSEVLSKIYTLDIMDRQGHSSFGWDESEDEWVIPLIQKKMDEGFVFWIVKRNPLREQQLMRVEDVREGRNVIIRDGDARTLFEQGRIALVSDEHAHGEETVERIRTTTSAREAARNDTLAHRRPGGG